MKCACPSKSTQRLNHRVTIYAKTYTQDAANEQIATDTVHATRKAFCRAMSPREVVQSEQVQGALGWIVELTYDPKTIAITSDMTMKLHSFGNRTVWCDGPAMPMNGEKRRVQVRAVEQTA